MNHVYLNLLAMLAVVVFIRGSLTLARSAIRLATPREPGELRQPYQMPATGIVSGAFAAIIVGGGVVGGMSPVRDDFLPWLLLVAFFGGTSLYCVVASGNWRLWVSWDGIQLRDGWGRVGPLIEWSQVKRVKCGWRHFIFECGNRAAIRVPLGTPGTLELLGTANDFGVELDPRLRWIFRAAR